MLPRFRPRPVVAALAVKPALLYSTRRLNPGYAGPLLQVRRTSDGLTRDIYPDPAGNLDTQDLLAFCNPGNTAFGPLDGLPAAPLACFGLRRLRGGYTGFCITVRRSSDSTTKDIGFGPDGRVDVADLLSFVGTGDGFISIWFDQSGNGRNVAQSAASLQAQIVSAGVLLTLNGQPSANFASGKYYATTANATWLNVGTYTLSAVAALASTPTGSNYLCGTVGSSTDTGLHWGWRSSTLFTLAQYGNDADFGATANTQLTFYTTTKNGPSGAQQFSNGTSVGTNVRPNATLNTAGAFQLGAGFKVGDFWNGYISELSVHGSVLSATARGWLEHEQSGTFGIAGITCSTPRGDAPGSAFVSTWYDQQGGQHITQSGASAQPCLVAMGVLQTLNGEPAPLFGGGQFLRRTGASFNPSNPAFSAVASLVNVSGGSLGLLSLAQGTTTQNDWNTLGAIAAITRQGVSRSLESAYNGSARITGPLPAYRQAFTVSVSYGIANLVGSVNGTSSSVAAFSTSVTATVITVGARNDGSAQWVGQIAEVAAFASNQATADRQALEADQGIYYGITFTR